MRPLLDIKLLAQPFNQTTGEELKLEQACTIARLYAQLENSISVLSDLKTRKSYIYYGALAQQLGLNTAPEVIDSIWEDELLARVHSEDLARKYRLELQYFQLLKTLSTEARADYGVITRLRIKDVKQCYLPVQHRLVYLSSAADGSIRLALCLYNRLYNHRGFEAPAGVIINSRTGQVVQDLDSNLNSFLSPREIQVLQLIGQGKRSKEIALQLGLSINTVNRHRQNIFEKLNVTNAIEACRVYDTLLEKSTSQ